MLGSGADALTSGGNPSRNVVQVAAFGDSAMWGQGLRRQDRYAALLLRMLPAIYGTPAELVWDRSRSGAQIYADQDTREVFLDRFPALFHNDAERQLFRDGSDESPASGLYGEVPAPFPTISRQVDMVGAEVGQGVDLALVDGGANDINLEDIINPVVSTGKFIERWDAVIRSVGYDDVVKLLVQLRKKCPNAVILFFGIWAPLTEQSRAKSIQNYFKYEKDSDFRWWLNMHVAHSVDVDALIAEAMTRSQWMRGRFHYWARQAVKDLNLDAETRGPGVLFVPSGLTNDNAIFARAPFLFEDYIYSATNAAGAHVVKDPALPRRVEECPRASVLTDLIKMYSYVEAVSIRNDGARKGGGGAQQGPKPTSLDRDSADAAAAMATEIDAPLELKALLTQWGRAWQLGWSYDFVANVWTKLAAEIARIQNCLIASLGHPNPQGAQSYADSANRRLTGYRAVLQQIQGIERHPGPQPGSPVFSESLDAELRRYRLRGLGSLLADVGHLDVDSLAVRVVTRRNSDANLRPDIWLVVTTLNASGQVATNSHRLNFRYRIVVDRRTAGNSPGWTFSKLYPHFEPGQENFFTVDPLARLRLEEITGCAMVLGVDPIAALGLPPPSGHGVTSSGTTWRPASVELEVNGVKVVHLGFPPEAHFEPGSHLDLKYPDPNPGYAPPILASTSWSE